MRKIWNFLTDEKHSRGVTIVVTVLIAVVAGSWTIINSDNDTSAPVKQENQEKDKRPPQFLGPEFNRFGDHLFGYAKLVTLGGKPTVNLEFSNGQRRDTVLRAEVVCISPTNTVINKENVAVKLGNSGGMASAFEDTRDIYLDCYHPNSYQINWGK
ncbi:MAG: hypothetical protein ACKVI8_14520 [Paraglaciecola sp.]